MKLENARCWLVSLVGEAAVSSPFHEMIHRIVKRCFPMQLIDPHRLLLNHSQHRYVFLVEMFIFLLSALPCPHRRSTHFSDFLLQLLSSTTNQSPQSQKLLRYRLLLFILQTNELSKPLIVGWPRSYTTLSPLTAGKRERKRNNISRNQPESDDSRLTLKRLPVGSFSDVERIIACVNHAPHLHFFLVKFLFSSSLSVAPKSGEHAAAAALFSFVSAIIL